MSKGKYDDIIKAAIRNYLECNRLATDYPQYYGFGKNWGSLDISDPPLDFDPNICTIDDASSDDLVKPVLIARVNDDGSVCVEETEYTAKYMYKVSEEEKSIAV